MKPASINWEQVKERLRASGSALEEALAESPERIEAAYRHRALRLANAEADGAPRTAGLPVMVVRLAQERYAIELKELADVLPFARCTPVPGAPSHFRGVIEVRGELRTVVDLGRLLAPSECEAGDAGFVLMVRHPGREIGLRVDHIEELSEIRLDAAGASAQGRYVKGMAAGTLMLLSVEAVLAEVFSKEEF